MSLNANKLAAGAVLVGLLAVGTALPASALAAPAAVKLPSINWPWQEQVAAESIETGEYAAAMTVGQTQQLSPTVLPEGATDKVSFVSSNENVVVVSSSGVVQAVSTGTVRVTATAGAATAYYDITVQTDPSGWVTDMDITLSASRILVDDTASVQIQILPTNATNTDQLTLSSSDESVATVNNFGKITGIAPGTATITATCGSVSASAKIAVVSSASETVETESITLNTTYVVLKPGGTVTLKASVSPSSASQSLTYKTNNSGVAAVSSNGVITATGTGATSVIVSNGTASALVTVIVNRNASAPSNNGSDATPDDGSGDAALDPVVEAIQSAEGNEVTLPQSSVPTLTSEMLNALHDSGKKLILTADEYTLSIDGAKLSSTSSELDTAIDFKAADEGLEFTLNNGELLPGDVEITVTGEAAAYKKLYLYNAASEKWQYLNRYTDGVISANTAGRYMLTNDTLNHLPISWGFLIAAAVTGAAIGVVYIAFKKRYWFW